MENLFKALGALPYTAEDDEVHLRALEILPISELVAKRRRAENRRFQLLQSFPALCDPTIGPSHPQTERLRSLDRKIRIYNTAIERKQAPSEPAQELDVAETRPLPRTAEAISIGVNAQSVSVKQLAEDPPSGETASALTEAVAEEQSTNATTAVTLATSRREMVKQFLIRCNDLSSVRIIRKHIWQSAGHKSPRQFQYWQAEQDRSTGTNRGATEQDDQNFGRILSMEPNNFLELIKKKGIIGTER